MVVGAMAMVVVATAGAAMAMAVVAVVATVEAAMAMVGVMVAVAMVVEASQLFGIAVQSSTRYHRVSRCNRREAGWIAAVLRWSVWPSY